MSTGAVVPSYPAAHIPISLAKFIPKKTCVSNGLLAAERFNSATPLLNFYSIRMILRGPTSVPEIISPGHLAGSFMSLLMSYLSSSSNGRAKDHDQPPRLFTFIANLLPYSCELVSPILFFGIFITDMVHRGLIFS